MIRETGMVIITALVMAFVAMTRAGGAEQEKLYQFRLPVGKAFFLSGNAESNTIFGGMGQKIEAEVRFVAAGTDFSFPAVNMIITFRIPGAPEQNGGERFLQKEGGVYFYPPPGLDGTSHLPSLYPFLEEVRGWPPEYPDGLRVLGQFVFPDGTLQDRSIVYARGVPTRWRVLDRAVTVRMMTVKQKTIRPPIAFLGNQLIPIVEASKTLYTFSEDAGVLVEIKTREEQFDLAKGVWKEINELFNKGGSLVEIMEIVYRRKRPQVRPLISGFTLKLDRVEEIKDPFAPSPKEPDPFEK